MNDGDAHVISPNVSFRYNALRGGAHKAVELPRRSAWSELHEWRVFLACAMLRLDPLEGSGRHRIEEVLFGGAWGGGEQN